MGDFAGISISTVGFLVEHVADLQKYKFNQAFAFDSNKEWIASGLWRFSRHPNYCGEIMIWTGISIVCFGGLQDGGISDFAQILVTPVWSFFFLVFTSLMLLEKRADAKWGGEARYH